jgi:hypothetical protein
LSNWIEEFHQLNPDAVKIEEKKAAKEYKIDLFKTVIPALDRRDKKFFSKLTEEQKKDISIWLLTRWMSSTLRDPGDQICNVNIVVNSKSKFLTKHKELQWMLLAMTGSGKLDRHSWIAPPKGIKKNRIEELILKYYPNLNSNELELFQKINTIEDIEEFLKDNGLSDKEIEDLLTKGK